MLEDLQSRLTHLEKHIEEQDAEMYQLSKRVDALVKVAKEQKAQLASLASLSESGAAGSGGLPADEKPPHY
jgi:uncharacterized coiled-coil protein SlyX